MIEYALAATLMAWGLTTWWLARMNRKLQDRIILLVIDKEYYMNSLKHYEKLYTEIKKQIKEIVK
jgi:hypothetical protein